MSTDKELDKLEQFLEQDLLVNKMKTIMALAWTISRELARENGGSVRDWLSAGLVLAWRQWKAEEALMDELEVPEDFDWEGQREKEAEPEDNGWETPTFSVVKTWVKPWYRINKDKAWKTIKFDEYQLEVLFKGKSVMVDYQMAKTDGLLAAVEKAGKEATGEVKELLRELWKVVRPYKVKALAREQAIEELQLADARPAKEPFSFKDTAKGVMYAVLFRGKTVYIVKNVVLKHGWRKAIEYAAKGSNSEQYKELLRGLWLAV